MGPKGERMPWGYYKVWDTVMGLGTVRQRMFLQRRVQTSPITNALGACVFLGTPFYVKRWEDWGFLLLAANAILFMGVAYIMMTIYVYIWKIVVLTIQDREDSWYARPPPPWYTPPGMPASFVPGIPALPSLVHSMLTSGRSWCSPSRATRIPGMPAIPSLVCPSPLSLVRLPPPPWYTPPLVPGTPFPLSLARPPSPLQCV